MNIIKELKEVINKLSNSEIKYMKSQTTMEWNEKSIQSLKVEIESIENLNWGKIRNKKPRNSNIKSQRQEVPTQ